MQYLCPRLGHGFLLLLGVSALTVLLAEAAPGTYFDELRLDSRVPATVPAWLIAVPVGICAASRKGGWADGVTAGATTRLGNLRRTIFDHHALWNAEELFWRGRPPGAPR